ncbi:MAG TPA: class I SAM-dependent methyltransferase [Vicinamibacteria bacterium]|nr:class I SAM-dependent methyltransferase [Vicinamibacteria bacterium]
METRFSGLRWPVRIRDWTGATYRVGGEREHWCGEPLTVVIKTEFAGRKLFAFDAFRFLECFLRGEVDLEGNLYILSEIRREGVFPMKFFHGLRTVLRSSGFQNQLRARLSVKKHYDVSQEAINLYLDKAYLAYSCAMFEHPQAFEREELLRVGKGRGDTFDSLEKAQWRKFQDAVDFIAPEPGDTLLDVGCGYGGQLRVALEGAPFGKVVGWTHSSNQAKLGSSLLESFDPKRWELHEGDYRQESRVFDHVTSVGMVSHVGPRGLVPYMRKIRACMRTGGRYLHHALMVAHDSTPHDLQVGLAFNKRYMWPGFHWFTLGTHVRALERNGFEVQRAVNLSADYAKTTAAWYERMMANQAEMVRLVGEPAFRAKRCFLAGISGTFESKGVHVYRLYCVAV